MKVAEMESKHNTRKSSVPKGYYYCKHCGRTISTKASLCQACREFEAMIDHGKDRVCSNGHAAKVGHRCAECERANGKREYKRRMAKRVSNGA
jgi:predicted ATP-dependent serine protease